MANVMLVGVTGWYRVCAWSVRRWTQENKHRDGADYVS